MNNALITTTNEHGHSISFRADDVSLVRGVEHGTVIRVGGDNYIVSVESHDDIMDKIRTARAETTP